MLGFVFYFSIAFGISNLEFGRLGVEGLRLVGEQLGQFGFLGVQGFYCKGFRVH